MTALRHAARDERGFSMITVMLVMLVAGLFVSGAYAMADGDLPIAKRSQDRKEAWAAAEAGLSFYAFHLAQDNLYWAHCTDVAAPNATEPSPVAEKWYGDGTDTRDGHWRTVPGMASQYAIELLPATVPSPSNPRPQCVEDNEASMLDPNTGMFRIRVTGRKGSVKRSIVASFRRKSLLDYLWLTNYETQDPNNYPPGMWATWAATNCDDYRGVRHWFCSDQQFATDDRLEGPFHSNDSILTCNGSTFGRVGKNDQLEVSAAAPGWDNVCGDTPPNFLSPFNAGQPSIDIPESNSALETVAATGGKLYTGVTRIRLDGNQMYVNGVGPQALPTNGVIYVKSDTAGCGTTPAILADYADPASCGNLYISGTYSRNLTVAAANDVIIAPTAPGAADAADITRVPDSDAVLGIIANNFVRVAHRVTRTAEQAGNPLACTNEDTPANPNLGDVHIEAAILSVKHSFTVDNYGCGAAEGYLFVKGVIAQNFRGTVGTTGGTGYLKRYSYDDLMKFRTPPYFLEPVAAPWRIARMNEQVPAR